MSMSKFQELLNVGIRLRRTEVWQQTIPNKTGTEHLQRLERINESRNAGDWRLAHKQLTVK
jgi:hypothetical protein